jgi:hypothetical protein
MKIAVWHSKAGPAAAFTLPAKKTDHPEAAYAHGIGPQSKPWRSMNSKGSQPSWEEWAEHLTHQAPYSGWWSVEEVPDSTPDIQSALDSVISRGDNRLNP